MDFQERQTGLGDHVAGVSQRVRVVGKRGRVDNDRRPGINRLVQPRNEFGFRVSLPNLADGPLWAHRLEGCGNAVQAGGAIDVGVTRAETPEIGAIENNNPGHPDSLHSLPGDQLVKSGKQDRLIGNG